MRKFFVFPDPLDATCILRSDYKGLILIAKPDIHPTGREGQSFDITEILANGHGALIRVSKDKYIPMEFKGSLGWDENINDELAWLKCDDFHMTLTPTQPPVDPLNPFLNPLDVINEVYATGNYNIATHEGAGQFTEECCKRLHERQSVKWGHFKKFPGQNQYNGHAVDAIQLLEKAGFTSAGGYDIILNAGTGTPENPSKPQFIFKGAPAPEIWYYPA